MAVAMVLRGGVLGILLALCVGRTLERDQFTPLELVQLPIDQDVVQLNVPHAFSTPCLVDPCGHAVPAPSTISGQLQKTLADTEELVKGLTNVLKGTAVWKREMQEQFYQQRRDLAHLEEDATDAQHEKDDISKFLNTPGHLRLPLA